MQQPRAESFAHPYQRLHYGIVFQACDDVGGVIASHRPIHYPCQGIDIRPRTLISLFRILLKWRKTRRDYRRHRSRHAANREPR
jgi:hypothetical protein